MDADATPSANFKVRQVGSAEELATVFTTRQHQLQWRPGALDHVSYFAVDETGFYAGELDGKVISCINVVK